MWRNAVEPSKKGIIWNAFRRGGGNSVHPAGVSLVFAFDNNNVTLFLF